VGGTLRNALTRLIQQRPSVALDMYKKPVFAAKTTTKVVTTVNL
jgi:hypothetical protein